jgi:hypothetical protein
VRITMIEESEDGDLAVTAEDFPAGIASASRYGAPGAGGNLPANNTPPGPTTAQAIFEGPGCSAPVSARDLDGRVRRRELGRL